MKSSPLATEYDKYEFILYIFETGECEKYSGLEIRSSEQLP